MSLPCVCCGKSDALTGSGGLFCHPCSDNASELEKDILFSAYVNRMASLRVDMDAWGRAA